MTVTRPAASTPVRAPARRVSQRVASITESTTLAIDAKAKQLKADGHEVILYGTGEPDFPTPAHIVAAAEAACSDPRFHHYTPSAGLPELRQAIVDKTARDSGLVVTPAQVVVTNGGKQALYNAFAALLEPGDEVLLPTPHWTTYPESIKLAGATPVEVATDETSGYLTDVEQLEAARTARTRALVFVSPSNPTGAVYSAEQTAAIGRWALEHGIWVVTDEIYEHLRYGSAAADPYASMPVLVPELADQTVVVNGVAKTYAMTGWRVGWTIAPPDVSAAMASLQSHSTSNVANVSQAAALAALTGPQDEVATMRAAFDRRRQTMLRMLAEIDGVTCPEPLGAFYCYPSVKELLGRSYGGRRPETSAELADLALEQIEIAAVPGEAFGTPGYLRFSYALGDDDLVEGLQRLQRLVVDAH